jgi:glutamine synthetase
MPTSDVVLAQAARTGVRSVELQFTDIAGALKSVTIPVGQLESALLRGTGFDGSAVEGIVRVAERDLVLRPDPGTFATLPWEQASAHGPSARLMCDLYTPGGERFAGDPRYALQRAADEAAQRGLTYLVAPEVEFFLFRSVPDAGARGSVPARLLPADSGGYFDTASGSGARMHARIAGLLQRAGVGVESMHHELASGQHEVDLAFCTAPAAADTLVTLKHGLRAIAQGLGLDAVFMPKPRDDAAGSGMHVHQRMLGRDGGDAFFDPASEYQLSALARWFIAGQLAHARALCAVLAPLVNSYKRLVPGFEAPVYVSWARTNRSALVRVPALHAGEGGGARVELRSPDPSCNPYLALAAMLRAGLDGIDNRTPLPPAVEEDLQDLDRSELEQRSIATLPASLGEAIEEMEWDPVIRHALGEPIFDSFLAARAAEWDAYRRQVTQWELDRYYLIS